MIIIAQNITKQGFFNNRGSFRSTFVENPLQITPFLCKTKPILKSHQCPQTLLQKQLMENFAPSANQKTKPIQSQFPKRQKMNISSVLTKDYKNEHPWKPKKTNPIKPNFRKARELFGEFAYLNFGKSRD